MDLSAKTFAATNDAMVDAWKRIHLSPSQFKVLYSVLFDVSIWELCECVMVSVS